MQRSNYLYRITYGILILVFLIWTIFYRQPFLAILLLLIIILPIISLMLAYFSFRRLEFKISPLVSTVSLPDKPVVILSSINPTLFPFLNCELTFSYQNLFYPNTSEHVVALPIEARRTQTFKFPFSVSQPGLFQFSLQSVRLTDYLHLYTFFRDLGKEVQITILPKKLEISFQADSTHTESEDSEFYDPLGTPSTDIREVREYIPGDRMQDIHWKLSARMSDDDLLVKLFERSFDDSLLFLPELYKEDLSDTLHTLYAISMKLIRKKEVFRLALFQTDTLEFNQMVIHDEEELIQAFLVLYYQSAYDTMELARSTYQTIYPTYGSFYYIHGTSIDLVEAP